MILKCLKFFI